VNAKCLSALLATLMLPGVLAAQFVPNPQAIPRTGNPPVVFINGFQLDCSGASFQGDFGIADQVLEANGRASLFFNICTVPNANTIELLGNAFGTYISSLTYSDGEPVRTIDVLAYSMGGLVLRSYLSGKQDSPGIFKPPVSVPIRKAIFAATPNFGSPVGALALGTSSQADELSSGSHFLMDLNTWNQNHDDLRGLDAIALAGTDGTGIAVAPGFDDGLVALSSASLHFYMSRRTRVLPLCHSANGRLSQVGLCPLNAKGIIKILSATDDNARIVVSFLAGTSDWQTIGGTIEQNSFLQNGSGITVRARTASDQAVFPSPITATPYAGGAKRLNMSNSEIGWTDLLTAGHLAFGISAGSQGFTQEVEVQPGGAQAIIVKPGPSIALVIPAPAVVSPLVVAPRMIISIYGKGLDEAAVSINGTPLNILYGSDQQINAVMPATVAGGLAQLSVQNPAGTQTVNLYIESAFPAVFTIGQLGENTAAAVNATTGTIVSAASPLRAGDYVQLYLTGLGTTARSGDFDLAALQPTVSIGGMACRVTYAGAAPGFTGLDQINCIVPSGIGGQSAATVVITRGVRSSPVTTVAIR
jgi:uncharacterized protein (TIGR03437 family)